MLYVYLFSCVIIFVYMMTVFALACIKKDNSIVDIAYGGAFIVTSASMLALGALHFTLPLHTFILFILICIWGTRLSLRIYKKNQGKPEDFRYKAWRDTWTQHGSFYFYARSFVQIFLVQGFVVSIVLLPFSMTILAPGELISLSYIALSFWVIGFLFESIGDAQLDAFIKDPNPLKGMIMKTGLWKYTRHPNYFGESLMWWGLGFLAFSVSGNPFVFLSPLLITYLLLYVSGIPMLEKKWEGVEEWELYKQKTSAFLPLPPRS